MQTWNKSLRIFKNDFLNYNHVQIESCVHSCLLCKALSTNPSTPILSTSIHTFADLKLQGLSSSPINSPLNLISPNQLVLIRHTSQLSLGGIILPISKVIVLRNRIPIISRIKWLLGVHELVALNRQLGALARVDAVTDVLVVVVVQVAGTEAERRTTRVDVVPVVVVVSDAEVAGVFIAVAVGVAD